MSDGEKRMERRLVDLRASNARREDALHEKGHCTEASIPGMFVQSALTALVDRLGLALEVSVAVEEKRAEQYDALDVQLAEAERAARSQQLLQGVAPLPNRPRP